MCMKMFNFKPRNNGSVDPADNRARCRILDIDKIQEGAEVIVQWGDFGGKIKNVRATITRYPYIDLVDNKDYDLSTVPSGVDR